MERPPSVRIFYCLEKANRLKPATKGKDKICRRRKKFGNLPIFAPQYIPLSLTDESHWFPREEIDCPLTPLSPIHCFVCRLEKNVISWL